MNEQDVILLVWHTALSWLRVAVVWLAAHWWIWPAVVGVVWLDRATERLYKLLGEISEKLDNIDRKLGRMGEDTSMIATFSVPERQDAEF